MSSSHVNCVAVETSGPVYTAKTVSKLEPRVSIVTEPNNEGVKLYHTVLSYRTVMPKESRQSNCSPSSVVPTIVLLVSVYGSGETVIALAKLSFAGVVPETMLRLRSPGIESTLPICI